MLEKFWGNGNTPALLVGMQAGTALLDVIVSIFRKLGSNLPQDSVTLPLGIYPKDAQSCHSLDLLTLELQVIGIHKV